MKPPRRQRESRQAGHIQVGSVKWRVQEQRRLLEGLKKYGGSNVADIHKEFLPKISVNEIELHLRKLKLRAARVVPRRPPEEALLNQAPIEVWLTKAEDLMQNAYDYSSQLGKVFSMMGSLEPHDPLEKDADVNWGLIYHHIGDIMQGRTPELMPPTESLVLVDLLRNLARDLGRLDIEQQTRLMQRKYDLLTRKVDPYMDAQFWVDKALNEDPLEKEAEHNRLLEGTAGAPCEKNEPGTNAGSGNSSRTPHGSGCDKEPATRKQPHYRTQLFSINPFCIPVKYLHLKPKQTNPS